MKEGTQENKHLIASDVLGRIKLVSAYQVEKAMKQYYQPEYHAHENYEGSRNCHRNPSVETILWQKTNFNI